MRFPHLRFLRHDTHLRSTLVHLAHRKGMVCAHIFWCFDLSLTILRSRKPRLLTDCIQISNLALAATTSICRALPAAVKKIAVHRVGRPIVASAFRRCQRCCSVSTMQHTHTDVLHVLRAEWARTPSDSTPQTSPRWNFNC